MNNTEWDSEGWRKLFLEVLTMMCHMENPPTLEMVNAWFDKDDDYLRHHCACLDKLGWMTGIHMIEAAQLIVEGAYENANIDEFGNLWPVHKLGD